MAVVGAHTISGSYSGDTTHLSSAGSFVVTANKHATSTVVSCAPDTVPVGSPTSCTATVTDSTPTSASAPSGTVSWSASSVPPGGGSFSASRCSPGDRSTTRLNSRHDPSSKAGSSLTDKGADTTT